MNMLDPGTSDRDPAAAFLDAEDAHHGAVEQLAALYRELAAEPSLWPARETVVREAEAERVRRATELGVAVGRLSRAGWRIEVQPPDDLPESSDAREVTPPLPPAPPVEVSEGPCEDVASPPAAVPDASTEAPVTTSVEEAPPRVPPPVLRGEPATPESLARLRDAGLGAARVAAERAHDQRQDAWLDVADLLGRTPSIDEVATWLPRLGAWVAGAVVPSVPRQEAVRARLELAVLRLRSVQERLTAEAEPLRSSTDRLISAVGRRRRDLGVGFVFGLDRAHTPRRGTWADDAGVLAVELGVAAGPRAAPLSREAALDHLSAVLAQADVGDGAVRAVQDALAVVPSDDPRLVALAAPHRQRLVGRPFKALRAALRARSSADDAAAGDPVEEHHRPREDWPLWPLTRGRRCLLVGNVENRAASERLARTFDLAAVEWLVVDPRQQAAGHQRIANGNYDLVLFTRFRGHDTEALTRACRDAGVRFARLRGGYNPAQVRAWLERRGGG